MQQTIRCRLLSGKLWEAAFRHGTLLIEPRSLAMKHYVRQGNVLKPMLQPVYARQFTQARPLIITKNVTVVTIF